MDDVHNENPQSTLVCIVGRDPLRSIFCFPVQYAQQRLHKFTIQGFLDEPIPSPALWVQAPLDNLHGQNLCAQADLKASHENRNGSRFDRCQVLRNGDVDRQLVAQAKGTAANLTRCFIAADFVDELHQARDVPQAGSMLGQELVDSQERNGRCRQQDRHRHISALCLLGFLQGLVKEFLEQSLQESFGVAQGELRLLHEEADIHTAHEDLVVEFLEVELVLILQRNVQGAVHLSFGSQRLQPVHFLRELLGHIWVPDVLRRL
mmetsp:Transcript_451/g.1277  ORF Transcript_451/g.1277 Transcript_451/m.1277 type:complete len:263 (-) Transcript_451:6163-6951(-)